MWLSIILGIAAGLGLFLFGMSVMSEGLQKAAGRRLKSFIERMTRNRFIAVIAGTIVTMVIQSSSATSVMVVGLVNAGIMKLSQAVGVIMGANIGTTITSQLISLDVNMVAPILVMLGMVVKMSTKVETRRHVADIFIGLGVLFIGMNLLRDSLSPLREVAWFRDLLIGFQHNPIMGILAGFGITLLLQSSSASMGILVALAAEGMLPLGSAMYILYGDNIGTCTTALISSIGSSANAKRVGIIHLAFNIIGTIIFSLVLGSPIGRLVSMIDPGNVARQIANAHSIFNIINVILLFPFGNFLMWISMQVIRDKEVAASAQTTHLDHRVLKTPFVATQNALEEMTDMAILSAETVDAAIQALITKDKDLVMKTLNNEYRINLMEKEIIEYLIELSKSPSLNANDRDVIDALFHTINDIERIGDHAENISDLAEKYIDEEMQFDEPSLAAIYQAHERILKGIQLVIEAIREGDLQKAQSVMVIEKEFDKFERSTRKATVTRMHVAETGIDTGILILDLLSNLERVSDHFKNIAQTVVQLDGQTRFTTLDFDDSGVA